MNPQDVFRLLRGRVDKLVADVSTRDRRWFRDERNSEVDGLVKVLHEIDKLHCNTLDPRLVTYAGYGWDPSRISYHHRLVYLARKIGAISVVTSEELDGYLTSIYAGGKRLVLGRGETPCGAMYDALVELVLFVSNEEYCDRLDGIGQQVDKEGE